ncbi:MAG: hypothetical protein LBT80_03565 [Lactobacillaceae bacterium]|nr:hypothetical protein [Lactobacillaceae bacterium]
MAKNDEPLVNTSEFDMGDFVAGKKFGNFEHDFKGIVEKIYEHSLLVMITENDPEDNTTVNEYNRRAVIRMSETKILIKTDNPAPRPEPEEAEVKEDVPAEIINDPELKADEEDEEEE